MIKIEHHGSGNIIIHKSFLLDCYYDDFVPPVGNVTFLMYLITTNFSWKIQWTFKMEAFKPISRFETFPKLLQWKWISSKTAFKKNN